MLSKTVRGGFEFVRFLLKCDNPDFDKSNANPYVLHQFPIFWKTCCMTSIFDSKPELASKRAPSSTYSRNAGKRLYNGARKSTKRIGEAGEPWGRLPPTSHSADVTPSGESVTDLFVSKDFVHFETLGCQRC